jgi:catechol 2,3-dioxygenase-like lactoylglutathione lyase family enzyme
MSGAQATASGISCISLTSPDADRLSIFYETAFGFRRIASERVEGPAFERQMAVQGGAKKISLQLGNEKVELLEFDRPGRPYPDTLSSSDLLFQHFAIVVGDMAPAYRHLTQIGGWRPITHSEPQCLPDSSGAVTAFKFHDPDGHPLELLAFPAEKRPERWRNDGGAGPCLGIDHSAVSVSDTHRSQAFYRRLGFQVTGETINSGVEQERLDALADVHVKVSAMMLPRATPHLELLCYRSARTETVRRLGNNDVAATRLILEIAELDLEPAHGTAGIFTDPDGHRLSMISQSDDMQASF